MVDSGVNDVLDLRAFCSIVDLGSITAAARSLGETKGSVSRRLSRLEDKVGVRLVRRSSRLVEATPKGAAFRLEVARALEVLDSALAMAREDREVAKGHIRVTAPFDVGVGLFAPLIARFRAKHPEVSVEVILTETVLDFAAHRIDVAFRAASALPDSSLIAHRLEDIVIGLYATPTYLDKHGTPKAPADLASHPILARKSTHGRTSLTLHRDAPGKPSTTTLRVPAAITASDFAFCREAALADAGIAMLPSLTVRADIEHRRLVPVLSEYDLGHATLYLVHANSRVVSPAVRAFRDHVLGEYASTANRKEQPAAAGGKRKRDAG